MESPVKSLCKSYNELTDKDKNEFNLFMAKQIRKSQAKEIGFKGVAEEIIANDTWIQTDLDTSSKDLANRYYVKLTFLERKSKWFRILPSKGSRKPLLIIWFDPKEDDEEKQIEEKEWKKFTLKALYETGSVSTTWYLKKTPNEEEKAFITSEQWLTH